MQATGAGDENNNDLLAWYLATSALRSAFCGKTTSTSTFWCPRSTVAQSEGCRFLASPTPAFISQGLHFLFNPLCPLHPPRGAAPPPAAPLTGLTGLGPAFPGPRRLDPPRPGPPRRRFPAGPLSPSHRPTSEGKGSGGARSVPARGSPLPGSAGPGPVGGRG